MPASIAHTVIAHKALQSLAESDTASLGAFARMLDDKGKCCQAYILDSDYMGHYGQAVRLSAIYITALYEVYELLRSGGDFSEKKNWFLRVISAADLSCPLQTDIIDKAYAALSENRAGASPYGGILAPA